MAKATYKDAGVDLEVYRQAMERLPRWMRRTFTPRVMPNDGGFAGLCQLDFPSPLFARNYQQPVLVAGTDGVGTKLKIARLTDTHNTVGIDLVAMCINDVICCGAEPLLFLDYVAMSHDDPVVLEQIVAGISAGCLQASCALLGGETAIMPDLYDRGDYDLAGFAVGVVERSHVIDGKSIRPDDVVIGLKSAGLHSNGFSLVRKIVFDMVGLGVDDHVDELGETVGQALLRPTRIYAQAVRSLLNHYKVKQVIHGIAHITGGGLEENIQRILPAECQVNIDRKSWEVPAIFPWLQQLGGVEDAEMFTVFNMGIGMVLIVSPFFADNICRMLQELDVEALVIGQVSAGAGQVTLR